MSETAPKIEPPRASTVYLATLAVVPAIIFASVIVSSFVATFMLMGRVADGSLDASQAESLAESILSGELAKPAPQLTLSVVANGLAFLAVAFAVSRRHVTTEISDARLGLRPAPWLDVVVVAVGLLGLSGALDAAVMLADVGDQSRLEELRKVFAEAKPATRLALALVVGLGAGLPEEVFFRGFAFHRLRAAQGRTFAIITSAVLFGLFHVDPLHSGLTLIMGLFLAWSTDRTQSIFPAIAAHVLNNVVGAMTAHYAVPDRMSWVFLPSGLVLAALALLFLHRRYGTQERTLPWA